MGGPDKQRRKAAAKREFSRRAAAQRHHSAPAVVRPRLGALETTGIVARNLIPLVMILAFGWSLGQYLVLSVFNVTFSVTSIAIVGVSVSHRESMHTSGLDAFGSWLTVIFAGAFVAVLLTAMFGWTVALVAWESDRQLFDRSLVLSALAIVVAAAPGMYARYRADAASGLPEDVRKRRDQPEISVLMGSAALILFASFFVASWGRVGVVLLALLVTGLSLARDLRPDLMQRLLPPDKA